MSAGGEAAAPRRGRRCGVYVYYRVPRHGAARWVAQAVAMQAEIASRAGPMAVGLMRRADGPSDAADDLGGEVTLMEVYEAVGGDARGRRIADAVAAEASRRSWPATRHVEVFVDATGDSAGLDSVDGVVE